jgi:hypothetical protein
LAVRAAVAAAGANVYRERQALTSQRIGAERLAKRDQSSHLARSLFGVIGGTEDLVRQNHQRSAHGRDPLAHRLGGQPRRRPMLGRPMLLKRHGRAQHAGLLPAAGMGGDALAPVEDADQAGGALSERLSLTINVRSCTSTSLPIRPNGAE